MIKFIGARVLQTIPVLVIMSFVVFIVTSLLPGDAASAIVGDFATPEQVQRIREQLGLDQPIAVRYLDWIGGAISGDFGSSLISGQEVTTLLSTAIPVTLQLTLFAIIFAVVVGIPAGVLSATNRNGWMDNLIGSIALIGVSLPWFWLGLLLVLLFSLSLGWFPASGYTSFFTDPGRNLAQMALPVVTVGLGLAALVLRQTRASLLNVIGEDYMRTAVAKGMSHGTAVRRHALRNAMLPVVTVVGLQIGGLLGGAVVTETVFALPGLGRLLVNGIFSRDYPVIQAVVLVIVFGVLVVNLLTDIIYAYLDPKVQL